MNKRNNLEVELIGFCDELHEKEREEKMKRQLFYISLWVMLIEVRGVLLKNFVSLLGH